MDYNYNITRIICYIYSGILSFRFWLRSKAEANHGLSYMILRARIIPLDKLIALPFKATISVRI